MTYQILVPIQTLPCLARGPEPKAGFEHLADVEARDLWEAVRLTWERQDLLTLTPLGRRSPRGRRKVCAGDILIEVQTGKVFRLMWEGAERMIAHGDNYVPEG